MENKFIYNNISTADFNPEKHLKWVNVGLKNHFPQQGYY